MPFTCKTARPPFQGKYQKKQGDSGAEEAPGNDNGLTGTNVNAGASVTKSFPLPTEVMRGSYVRVAARVQAQELSAKAQPWNGLKLMVKVETPTRTDWPQPHLPTGSFDWQRFSHRAAERTPRFEIIERWLNQNRTAASERTRMADSFVDAIGVNTHLGYSDTIYRESDTIIKPRLSN